MQPVESCLLCQFLCHIVEALFFYQNSRKFVIFAKSVKFLSAGVLPPDPWPLGASPPDPHQSLTDGGSAPRPPQTKPPIANFWLCA